MNQHPLKFYIVEDEPDNRKGLERLINAGEQSITVGTAADVNAAFSGILDTKPDALLLDVKLEGGDAFHLLDKLKTNDIPIPPTILITGHFEFNIAQEALNRFREQVLQIIEKPFLENWADKYQQICEAIKCQLTRKGTIESSLQQDVLFLRSGKETFRVRVEEIEFVEVGGGGTIIVHTDYHKKIKVSQTLTKFLDEVNDDMVQIHRRYAIHKDKVSHINHEDRLLYLYGSRFGLDIGEKFYPKIFNLLAD